MQHYKILWADDEIDLLKPHILFLENKGYEVVPLNSGNDAIEEMAKQFFDIVFLDENMPGLSGIETLKEIKLIYPNIPVVMITKSEEEHIMEDAIGSQIADYLIKPLNPNQILLSVKRLLDKNRLVTEKTNLNYQQDFANLSYQMGEDLDYDGWSEIYRKLVRWELLIDQTNEKSMSEILQMQKAEANQKFANYVKSNYQGWINGQAHPLLSHRVLKEKVFPVLEQENLFLIVIDNLRFDQWEILEPEISKLFEIDKKETYYSILPTATNYARNAFFAGLMPAEIENNYKELWTSESDEGSKNKFESALLAANLDRSGILKKFNYHKILKVKEGQKIAQKLDDLMSAPLNVLVYNFVDMLSHARTDMPMIRELAPDESAYRELTKTWFNHSSLFEVLKKLADKKVKVMITTDHGTIRVKKPEKIIGDRDTNTNLRFKVGKNLNFNAKTVFHMAKPEEFKLPKLNLTSSYIFALEESFFAYPNNYNQYVNLYSDTFQHGGISMEEMIIPFITLKQK
jgi:CheY-like chemotaxis protein